MALSNKIIFLASLFLQTGCAGVFFQPSKDEFFILDPKRVVVEDFFLESEPGVTLHGWRFPAQLPDLTRTNPKGLVLQFHGNAENITTHFSTLVWLAHEGFDFMTFDYRGYGQSTGRAAWPGAILDGKKAIIDALAESRKKQIPLHLVGQSLGGAILMRSFIELKAEGLDLTNVKTMVIESSFHSYPKVASDVLSKTWITWPFQWLGSWLVTDRYSVTKEIANIAPTRILVVHGDQDPVVSFRFGKEIFELAKEPKSFWAIPNGGHIDTFQDPKRVPSYRTQLKQFLINDSN